MRKPNALPPTAFSELVTLAGQRCILIDRNRGNGGVWRMSFVSHSRHISSTATGIMQLCAGMLIIPILDVFAKLLGGRLDPVEVTLMRFIMQACLMAPFVIYLRLWQIPTNTLLIQAARGILLAIATVCFFAALQHLPWPKPLPYILPSQ